MKNPPRYRLLLLDPDREYLARLAQVLEADYEVCAMDHPVAALEQIDRYMPDIILLEVDLPEMDGIKFAHKIRRCPAHKRVPLVFVTTRDSLADRHLGFMVQAAMYLSKQLRPQRIALDLGIYIRENKPRIRPKVVDHKTILAELPPLPKVAPPPAVAPAPPPDPPAQTPPEKAPQSPGPAPLPNPPLAAGPAAAAPPPLPTAGSSPKPPAAAPRSMPERIRVLIADGEYATVFSIDSLLSDQFNCIAATSGSEALDKAQRFMPDLLILGMGLPEIPGYEVCQMLRSLPPFMKTPILGVTRGGNPTRTECERLYGITQVFLIPAEFDRLGRRVRELVREPSFPRQSYPQSFNEVWAEEENYRMLRG